MGGQNEEGKKTKNICKFNIKKCSLESSGHQLEFPSKFRNQNIFVNYSFHNLEERNFFYFFDCGNNIHIINKQQYIDNWQNEELQIKITS